MLRTLSLVAFAAAALAPTSASAGGGYDGYGYYRWGGPRVVIGAPAPAYGYGSCYVRRLAQTPWGPRWHLVNRCY